MGYTLCCTIYPCSLFYFIHNSLHFLIPYPYLAPLLFPSSWVTTSLFSSSVSLFSFSYIHQIISFFRFHIQWYNTVFVFSCLTYLTQHNALQVHPCCRQWKIFILFYGQVVFHCMCMYHIFFIHSSLDGYLGSVHTLVIIDSAVLNMGCIYFSNLCFLFFFRYILKRGSVVLHGSSSLSFLGNLHTIFHSGCTPTHTKKMPNFD